MKQAQLSGSPRVNVGKKDAKALRNAERVPCVLYGAGEQTHFHVKQIDIQKIIFSPDVFQVEIELEYLPYNISEKMKLTFDENNGFLTS